LRLDGDEVGAAVRTRDGVKPIFVSPGHRVSVRDAVKWSLATSRVRVPEPIRLAEQLVNRLKRGTSRPDPQRRRDLPRSKSARKSPSARGEGDEGWVD
jgi:deoxyribonuclease V